MHLIIKGEKYMSQILATLSSIHPILVCLLVMTAKIVEISIQSLKTCLMVKGQRFRAACLGFIECTIWGLVISTLIGSLGDNLMLLAFYCTGYATGLFIGSTLEGKLAFGTSNIDLMANEENTKLIVNYLKEHGRGFTVLDGHGATEPMNMIYVVLPRKEVAKTVKDIQKLCNKQVFFVTSEVSKYTGGYGIVK